MRTLARNLVFAVAAMLAAAGASQADARTTRINPHPGFVPRLGFCSYNVAGYGEVVTRVRWGSKAYRIGLEPNDVILSVNGFPLTYHGAWHQAVAQAAQTGGWLTLRIRDCRTGHIVHRSLSLFHNGGGGGIVGPVTPKSRPHW